MHAPDIESLWLLNSSGNPVKQIFPKGDGSFPMEVGQRYTICYKDRTKQDHDVVCIAPRVAATTGPTDPPIVKTPHRMTILEINRHSEGIQVEKLRKHLPFVVMCTAIQVLEANGLVKTWDQYSLALGGEHEMVKVTEKGKHFTQLLMECPMPREDVVKTTVWKHPFTGKELS